MGPLSSLAGEEPVAFRKNFRERVVSFWTIYRKAGVWIDHDERLAMLDESSGPAKQGEGLGAG